MAVSDDAACFVSLTRLRIRSILFMPFFLVRTMASLRQVRAADGFRGGALLMDRRRAFWTLTLWDEPAAMHGYRSSGAHRDAMPRLLDWCDEASVAHWRQPDATLPGWSEADARMRREGRPSKVRRPGPHHADLSFPPPRPRATGPIVPRSR